MSWIFRPSALPITNVNLVLQLVIVVAIVVGYTIIKRGRIRNHAYIMFSAVILHLLSILIAMAPAVVIIFKEPRLRPLVPGVGIHVVIGTVAIGLGIYIARNWRFDMSGSRCFRLKKAMRILLPLWVIELIFGIIIYYQLNP